MLRNRLFNYLLLPYLKLRRIVWNFGPHGPEICFLHRPKIFLDGVGQGVYGSNNNKPIRSNKNNNFQKFWSKYIFSIAKKMNFIVSELTWSEDNWTQRWCEKFHKFLKVFNTNVQSSSQRPLNIFRKILNFKLTFKFWLKIP